MNPPPIRILYLIDAFVSDKAGTESQLLKLIKSLPKNEYTCYIGVFKPTPWIANNYDRQFLFVGQSNSLFSFKFYASLIKLWQFIRAHKIDIVQAHFPMSITIGILIAALAGVKCILSCRRDMGYWYNPYLLKLLLFSNRFASKFIVNSTEIQRLIEAREQIPHHKIEIIYNGIDFPNLSNSSEKENLKHQFRIPANGLVIGTVANMNRAVKRIDLFIHMASDILKKNNNAFFIVVGSGHLLEDLGKLSVQLEISDHVRFLGSRSDVFEIVQLFDVAVCSSDSEGFSNAIIEYLACGIPCVATDVGGNKDIISHGHNGLLVPPGLASLLSEAVQELILDENKRILLGRQAKLSAAHFSTAKMITRYCELYNECHRAAYPRNAY